MNINVDINLLRSVFTVVCLSVFVGATAWAYSRRNKSKFEEAARLALQED